MKNFDLMALRCLRFLATSLAVRNRAKTRKSRGLAAQTFGVTFPLFAKIEVNGNNAHPLYAWLKQQRPRIFR